MGGNIENSNSKLPGILHKNSVNSTENKKTEDAVKTNNSRHVRFLDNDKFVYFNDSNNDLEIKAKKKSNFFSNISKFLNSLYSINRVNDKKTINQRLNDLLNCHHNNKYKYLAVLSFICPIFLPILIYRCFNDCDACVADKKMQPIKIDDNTKNENIDNLIIGLTNAVNNKDATAIIYAVKNYILNSIDTQYLETQRTYQNVLGFSAKRMLMNSLDIELRQFKTEWEKLKKENANKPASKRDNDLFIKLFNKHLRLLSINKLKEAQVAVIQFKQALQMHNENLSKEYSVDFTKELLIINNLSEEIDTTINSFSSREDSNTAEGNKIHNILQQEKQKKSQQEKQRKIQQTQEGDFSKDNLLKVDVISEIEERYKNTNKK